MHIVTTGRRQDRPGFTLIEMALVLCLIGLSFMLLRTISFTPSPKARREWLMNELSGLISQVYLSALTSGQLHRVVFDLEKNEVVVEKNSGKSDSQGSLIFEPLSGEYGFVMKWPREIEIKNLIINRSDELSKSVEVKTTKAWMYITADGVGQELIINMEETDREPVGRFSFVLNPFTLQLIKYDDFQKP